VIKSSFRNVYSQEQKVYSQAHKAYSQAHNDNWVICGHMYTPAFPVVECY